jgi:hypothetical protein
MHINEPELHVNTQRFCATILGLRRAEPPVLALKVVTQ